ncbi:hypothetical protein SAMN02745194_00552 [Roseomonas rosea]|uniref:YD repeat-containing protein n=1 Tax=Muricoccus roseus TaxID=198092 RepID=A0A1M6C1X0_9PROT|nr:hypothetical protein [Roseomonas rosea]SHI54831.1 hypothetical protein SAMN02745194_00552 [Roseomonas rosea]
MSGSAGDGYLDLTLDGDREEYYTPGEYYDLLDYVLEVRNGTLIRTDYDQEQYPFWSLIVSVWTLTGDPSNPLGPQISVTTRFDSGRTDVSETIFSNGPGSEILGHRVSHYDPSGRLVEHDVLDLSGTGTTYVLNEARQVEYQYTKALSTYGHGNWVQVATDFDLDNTQPWSRFTIQYVERRDSDPLPSRSEMLMDDGTSIVYDATFKTGYRARSTRRRDAGRPSMLRAASTTFTKPLPTPLWAPS